MVLTATKISDFWEEFRNMKIWNIYRMTSDLHVVIPDEMFVNLCLWLALGIALGHTCWYDFVAETSYDWIGFSCFPRAENPGFAFGRQNEKDTLLMTKAKAFYYKRPPRSAGSTLEIMETWWYQTSQKDNDQSIFTDETIYYIKWDTKYNTNSNLNYRQISNIRRILVGDKFVDHSDEGGESPVGAAPTTSSFPT